MFLVTPLISVSMVLHQHNDIQLERNKINKQTNYTEAKKHSRDTLVQQSNLNRRNIRKEEIMKALCIPYSHFMNTGRNKTNERNALSKNKYSIIKLNNRNILNKNHNTVKKTHTKHTEPPKIHSQKN